MGVHGARRRGRRLLWAVSDGSCWTTAHGGLRLLARLSRPWWRPWPSRRGRRWRESHGGDGHGRRRWGWGRDASAASASRASRVKVQGHGQAPEHDRTPAGRSRDVTATATALHGTAPYHSAPLRTVSSHRSPFRSAPRSSWYWPLGAPMPRPLPLLFSPLHAHVHVHAHAR